MNQAMYAAASGMAAEQNELDVVTENLANADVTAFKGHVAHIVALGTSQLPLGVTIDGSRAELTQGKIERTGGTCDLAIRGEGYFTVQRGREVAYTRDGAFSRDPAGMLSNADGWHLAGIHVPADCSKLAVAPDGAVSFERHGKRTPIGTLRIAVFAAPEHLDALAPGICVPSLTSGLPRLVHAGAEGGPAIAFGMLEHSNVSIVVSMMEILKAQRAYEADAKAVQASDDMTRIANNIERG